MPGREDAQDLASLLEHRARLDPDATFLRMQECELTYSEFNAHANRVATGLLQYEVGPGELVCVMLGNCLEFMVTWFGLLKVAAVEAPVNVSFRGAVLSHVVGLTKAKVFIIDEQFVDALVAIAADLPSLRRIFVRGDAAHAQQLLPQWHVLPWEKLLAADRGNPHREVEESDLAMLMFTSGTTGPSKACMLSHRYVRRHAEVIVLHLALKKDDCLYCPYPLFHADAAVFTVIPALILGAVAAIGRRFSASGFWNEVRAFGATVLDFMGATLTILWKQEAREDDDDNLVRLAWGVPMPDFWESFETRFGLKLVEVYGLTDAGLVAYEPLETPHRQGSCGRAIHPFDVQIMDERGFLSAPGVPGEIVIRSLEPSVLMDGYYGMPEETLTVFRDLWLHTGDIGKIDEDGFLYFLGRGKDSIRRRGENISAFEVEQALESHPAVLEAAAIGVPSELTEEDLKVCVVLRPGYTLGAEELVEYCEGRVATFMVPRYVEFMDSLPRTPTEKVEKYRLRLAGITETTWDREQSLSTRE